MYQITLLHTSSPDSSGTVVRTTHPDFLLHDTIEVVWPLNLVVGTSINVILVRTRARYLAHWMTNSPDLAYQFTYGVVMQLPSSW